MGSRAARESLIAKVKIRTLKPLTPTLSPERCAGERENPLLILRMNSHLLEQEMPSNSLSQRSAGALWAGGRGLG